MNIGSFLGSCPSGSGAGGGGTVTSITEDVNLFPEVLVNGVASFTITGSGTFAWSKVVQNANTAWLGPATGAPAVPTFRHLVPLDGEGAFWTILGNLGTNDAVNFIGTTDAQDWVWKTNNVYRGKINAGGDVGILTQTPNRLLDVGAANIYINGGNGIARSQVQDTGGSGGVVYNVKAWDATGDGVTSDEQFFRHAIEKMTADYAKGLLPAWGGVLEIPPGTYHFSAAIEPFVADITVPMKVKGAGIGITVLECDFGIPAPLFSFSLKSPAANETNPEGLFHGPIFEGISFNNVGAVVVPAFIQVNVDGTATKPIEGTTIRDCEFNGAQVGVALYETAATLIDHMVTRPGNTVNEILFSNTTFPDAGDSIITNCDFQSRNMVGGVGFAQIKHIGTNGTKIINNKFNGSAAAGDGPWAHIWFTDVVAPSEIIIVGNSFEGSDTYSIRADGAWGAGGRNVISCNQFDDASKGTGGHRISIAPDGAGTVFLWNITNNNFDRETSTAAVQNCIELLPTALSTIDNFEISGNVFRTAKATDFAVFANAAVTNLHLGDNTYVGFTTPVSLDAAATTEGITLFGSAGHAGNFIEAYRGARTSANLKFRVDEMGQTVIRWANIGSRGDQPPGFLSTCSINESNFIPTPTANTDTLAILSPRVDGGYIAVTGNSDVAGCSATGLDIEMGLNTAGNAPAAGTYTGNFLSFSKSTAGPVTTPVFWIDYRPQIVMYNVAAPAAIGATVGQLYFDIADSKFHVVDGAGNHAI